MTKNKAPCGAYVAYFETLRPDTIDQLDSLAAENMYFEDPFNQLTSRSDVKRLFRQMFDHMDDPAFKVSDVYWNDAAAVAVLKWRFSGKVRKIGTVDFEGLSEIRFDPAGLVTSHIDYWDAAGNFYEKIPLIGALLRVLRRSIRLS